MPNLPARNLSKAGIVKDVEPWNTPIEVWSSGCNVRFTDDKAMRSPVFRTGIDLSAPLVDGHGLATFKAPNGPDRTFALDSFGRIAEWVPGLSYTDVTGSVGFIPSQASKQFTSCILQGVLYVNRESHPPRYLGPAGTSFANLPNRDSDWRAKVLRAYQGFLVAFGVTKGATTFDTMVKWSDLTLLGQVPASWDTTDTTKLAGENTPGQMSGAIVDALNLRNSMVIYTDRQIWLMEYTGDSTFVFNFRKLWEDPKWGAINRNCIVEVNGQHVVFGAGDIYQHDGASVPMSIADGRVRKWIYSTMNRGASDAFYVAHNPHLNSVSFCYVSNDADVKFPSTTRCNRACTWNYVNNTWGIEDLPLSAGAAMGNPNKATTWNDLDGQSWDSLGGSWADMEDIAKNALLVIGNAGGTLTAPRIYASDPLSLDSRVALPMSAEANPPSYLEHGGIPLDMLGLPLEAVKRVQSLHPQGRILAGGPPTISIGAAMLSQNLPSYGPPLTFRSGSSTQVFTRATGAYLAFRLDAPPSTDFAFTGFDADIRLAGKRG